MVMYIWSNFVRLRLLRARMQCMMPSSATMNTFGIRDLYSGLSAAMGIIKLRSEGEGLREKGEGRTVEGEGVFPEFKILFSFLSSPFSIL